MSAFRTQQKLRSAWSPLAVLAALHCAPAAHANQALARKNDCLGCHSVARQLVRLSFKDVAARYAGQGDALEQLQNSIRNGSSGKWCELPMPPHPKLSTADLKKLATWVLGLKQAF
jgi:cytochrome c